MKRKFKVLTILLVGCFLFAGCGNKNDNVDKHIKLSAPDGVKVETYYDYYKEGLIVKLTNESSSDIKALDVAAKYSESESENDNNVVIENFKANSTTYAFLELPFDDNFEYYIPDSFNLNISTNSENLEGIGDVSQYFDQIKTDFSVNDNIIDYNLTNDTGKILGSVESLIVYFKDGKPIAGDYIMALDVEESFNLQRDVIYDGDIDNPKYLDYDNIEIYVTGITDDYEESDIYDNLIDGEDYFDEETIDEDDDMSWE